MNFESETQSWDPLEAAEEELQEAVKALKESGLDANVDFTNLESLNEEQQKAARRYMEAFQKLERVKAQSSQKAA